MNRENRLLITDELLWVWDIYTQLTLKTAGKLPIILEGVCRIYPQLYRVKLKDIHNTVTRWTWKHLDLDRLSSNIPPGHRAPHHNCFERIGISCVPTTVPGEMSVSYRWTGWVWEITSETSGRFPIILEESIEGITSNEESKTGRWCQHVTSWIENHSDLDRLFCPNNFPGTGTD